MTSPLSPARLQEIRAQLRKGWFRPDGCVSPEAAIRDLLTAYDALRDQLRLTKGAMDAQDEREQQAGEKCGISWLEHGCDWPDAVAERVVHLRDQLRGVEVASSSRQEPTE